jgi:hypothetical protein
MPQINEEDEMFILDEEQKREEVDPELDPI